MCDSRAQLKAEYKDFILNSRLRETEFNTNCRNFLERSGVSISIKFLPLRDLMKYLKKLKQKENPDLLDLVNVFQLLEKFPANLLAKPWCKDLFIVKVFIFYICMVLYGFIDCLNSARYKIHISVMLSIRET